jgi:hypothetical protein
VGISSLGKLEPMNEFATPDSYGNLPDETCPDGAEAFVALVPLLVLGSLTLSFSSKTNCLTRLSS